MKVPILTITALAVLCLEKSFAQTKIFTFSGGAGDRAGWSSDFAGDVNGDGKTDIIMGSWGADPVGADSGSATVFSGANGAILFTFNGQVAGERFGDAVAGAGDVNQDGFDDVIIGARNASGNAGRVEVRSGQDGSLLYQATGFSTGDYFGCSVGGVGDVNGDGFGDFAVGSLGYDFPPFPGAVGAAFIYSGIDGSLLYAKTGSGSGQQFGTSLHGLGDVNGDGRSDFIIGATEGFGASAGKGYAEVYSGATGALLFHLSGENNNDQFGHSVSDAGDVDQDGRSDIIVGAYQNNTATFHAGKAYVYSGSTGSLLYSFVGKAVSDQFGYTVAGAGDVNGDGFADVLVGTTGDDRNGSNSGSIQVYSGKDGSLLHDILGNAANDQLGFSVAGGGELTGDGNAEFLAGAVGSNQLAGSVVTYRGTPLTLSASPGTLSLASGGVQTMTLHAGPSYAGHTYFLVGSASGTSPGTDIGGLLIPLNLDPYFLFTINSPNQAPLAQSLGTLDASGNGSCSFSLPAGSNAALTGTKLHHAFAVIVSSPPFIIFPYASNPASLGLTP